MLGSYRSLRSGIEKGQRPEHLRAIPVQSCTQADSNPGDSAKPDIHEWFSTNLGNKESITAKQTEHSQQPEMQLLI